MARRKSFRLGTRVQYNGSPVLGPSTGACGTVALVAGVRGKSVHPDPSKLMTFVQFDNDPAQGVFTHQLTALPVRPTFEQACAQYPHRFTMQHVPLWANKQRPNGSYYAPQFRSDSEWYQNTLFAGEHPLACKKRCYTSNQTWPLGQSLPAPYRVRS